MNDVAEINDLHFDDASNSFDSGEDDIDDEIGNGRATDRRDEVREVRKMSSKHTFRLRMWRLVVTGVILMTALAVTFTTYNLLQQQEDKNFRTAVRIVLDSTFFSHVNAATVILIVPAPFF